MKAILSRVCDRTWSVARKLVFFSAALCAPLQAAQAQTSPTTNMAIAAGNGQSGQTYSTLPIPLTVSFDGTSTVSLEWHVTGGNAVFQEKL